MSEEVAQEEQDFKVAMQQLSAAAEKILPPMPMIREKASSPPLEHAETEPQRDVFSEKLQGLENSLLSRIERLADEMEAARRVALAEQFKKIDEQLVSIRSSESVNQQLFDSLHAEMLKYRDNFLHESLQKPFIHDLVYLYDHLNGLFEQLSMPADEKGTQNRVSQWRDNLGNAIHSLMEILHRFDVKEIEPRERVDRACHRVINFEPANFPEEDGAIVMRVKRGFIWRGKLIRPEEVIAKRFS